MFHILVYHVKRPTADGNVGWPWCRTVQDWYPLSHTPLLRLYPAFWLAIFLKVKPLQDRHTPKIWFMSNGCKEREDGHYGDVFNGNQTAHIKSLSPVWFVGIWSPYCNAICFVSIWPWSIGFDVSLKTQTTSLNNVILMVALDKKSGVYQSKEDSSSG